MTIRPPVTTMTDADIDHDLDRLEKLVHEAADYVRRWHLRAVLTRLPEIIELSLVLSKVMIYRVRRLEGKA